MSQTDETQFTDKWGISFLHCVNNKTVHEHSNLLAFYGSVTGKQSLKFSKSIVPPHSESSNLCDLFDPCRLRYHTPSNRQHIFKKQHGVTHQKTWIFSDIAVRSSKIIKLSTLIKELTPQFEQMPEKLQLFYNEVENLQYLQHL